jgi:hypothetical protein
VQFVARTWSRTIPEIPGFEICQDSFVRPQTAIRTYPRVRHLQNLQTGTSANLQYWAVAPWLEPVKSTIVAEDTKGGLQRAELEGICKQFRWTRLLTIELAFDFAKTSAVDQAFVSAHGIFGRSQPVGRRFFKDLRYGTRHSAVMVRGYRKPELDCYRVEVELHSEYLRTFGITRLDDLSKLPRLLCFSRINFVEIDWHVLADHLLRKCHRASVLEDARSQAYSIHRVLTLLRNEIGLANVHRFLRPLQINTAIKRQLEDWAKRWQNVSRGSF